MYQALYNVCTSFLKGLFVKTRESPISEMMDKKLKQVK